VASKILNTNINQYRELCRWFLSHPDEVLTGEDYFRWADRNKAITWGTGVKTVQDRLYNLSKAVLPPLPGAHQTSSLRSDFAVDQLVTAGALYRTGDGNRSGRWVLDTHGAFSVVGRRITLRHNVHRHNPTSIVQRVLIPSQGGPALRAWERGPVETATEAPKPTAPEAPEPSLNGKEHTPAPWEVVGIDVNAGGQLVLRRADGLVVTGVVSGVIET
jgi:hypothetical protein